jgi:cobalt-precorrin-5B (C1)-methyltransferase
MFLIEGITLKEVEITLPEGDHVVIPVVYVRGNGLSAEAAIRKDAGDDPDVTNGVVIEVSITEIEGSDVVIAAGEGVGTVTKPGLSVAPGEPAVNPVPRRMIRDVVREVTDRGMKVTFSIPGGKEIAARTFNPRLGIVGGLSILGTSGRVRPFSCPALRTSLKCLLDVAAACGIRAPFFVPGHIGERAARRHFRVSSGQVIEVGNEWGFMLDYAAAQDFEALMVLGHPGKLAKLAMGAWDTHSSRSKSAVPFVSALARDILVRPMQEMTTVEGLFSALPGTERKELGDILAEKIRRAIGERIGGRLEIAVVLVNMRGERIGSSGDLKRWT